MRKQSTRKWKNVKSSGFDANASFLFYCKIWTCSS